MIPRHILSIGRVVLLFILFVFETYHEGRSDELTTQISNMCPITIVAGASSKEIVYRYVVGFKIDGLNNYTAGLVKELGPNGGVLDEYVECDKVGTSILRQFILIDYSPTLGMQPKLVEKSASNPSFPVVMYYKPIQMDFMLNLYLSERVTGNCKKRNRSKDFIVYGFVHRTKNSNRSGTRQIYSKDLKAGVLLPIRFFYAYDSADLASDYDLVMTGFYAGCPIEKWTMSAADVFNGEIFSFVSDKSKRALIITKFDAVAEQLHY